MSGRGGGRLREERGSALVVAILVTVAILALGLATLSFADSQSRQGGNERIQESTFNLTEAVLRQQLFLVSQSWPGSQASQYPTDPPCTQDTAESDARCPSDDDLRASYDPDDPDTPDYADPEGYKWETIVQDNGAPDEPTDCESVMEYYTTDCASTQEGWDENNDGKVWVRASSTVRGRTRTVVTLISARRVPIASFPRNVITGGHFAIGNRGTGTIVDTAGPTGQPSSVQVRCTSPSDARCLDYESGKKKQIAPESVSTGYPGGDAMTLDELNGLRAIARQNGTYYESCSASPDLTGKVVFIESGPCTYNGGSFNPETPGTLVIATGTLTLKGNASFFGLVYGANKSPTTTGNVVTVTGAACIRGAVTVDGGGGVHIQSQGKGGCGLGKLVWDPTAIDELQTLGQATTEDGTWRELCVSQADGTDCPSQ